MKCCWLLFYCVITNIHILAQSNFGLHHDNFAGSSSIFHNPANSADTRFEFHLHVFGFSGMTSNNFLQTRAPYSGYALLRPSSIPDRFKTEYGNPIFNNSFITEKVNGRNIYAFTDVNVSILQMSYSLPNGNGIHMGYRVRAHASATGFDERVVKTFLEDMGTIESTKNNQTRLMGQTMTGRKMRGAVLGYDQRSIGYSHIFQDDSEHFIKFGVTIHYNIALYGGYLTARNLNFTLTGYDSLIVHEGELDFAMINEGFYENPNLKYRDFYGKSKLGAGLGLDLGIVYEYRPHYRHNYYKIGKKTLRNKTESIYQYRISASIVDLGYVNFRDNLYIFQQTVTPFKGQNIPFYNFNTASEWGTSGDIDSFIEAFFPVANRSQSFRMLTPARLHLNFDYQYQDEWYFTAAFQQSILTKMARGARMPNILTVGARYEKKWFTIGMPISVSRFYNMFNTGLYVRAGVFYLGTDHLGSFFSTRRINGTQIYTGFNCPIHFKKIQDSDGDGIPDKEDDCPNEMGPRRTKGCPDTDGDGIRDIDDKCPDIPGKSKYQGCPDEETLNEVLEEEEL